MFQGNLFQLCFTSSSLLLSQQRNVELVNDLTSSAYASEKKMFGLKFYSMLDSS